MFAPLVNYGLGHITSGSLASWQYMFLFAGSLTVVWSAMILFFLPADPIRSRGFTDRERYIAVARLRSNNTGVRNLHWKAGQVLEALLDIKFWLIFAMGFLMQIANGPQSTFQAIIVQSFGFTALNSLLFLMPYGFIIGCIELGAPYLAYKFKNIRTYLIVACQLLTIMSSLLLWLLPRSQLGGLLIGVYFLGSFAGSYVLSMTLQVANTAGYTKRAFMSSGMFVGYCLGNVVGPLVFKPQDAPRYISGWIVVVITGILAAITTLVYRFVCIWENKKRDATGIMEGTDNAFEDDLTDKKVCNRKP
jgi:MFS transporter, ACS family, DAL5 transporter family protein